MFSCRGHALVRIRDVYLPSLTEMRHYYLFSASNLNRPQMIQIDVLKLCSQRNYTEIKAGTICLKRFKVFCHPYLTRSGQ